jgi:hypothetical protein
VTQIDSLPNGSYLWAAYISAHLLRAETKEELIGLVTEDAVAYNK